MKHIILPLSIILSLSNNFFAQEHNSLKKELENYIPYYIVDNYCSKTGLINIVNFAKVDDRIWGIQQKKGGVIADSSIVMRYNNTILKFEKKRGIPYLGNFNVYFSSKIEMENFTFYFLKIMDPTEEYFGHGRQNNLWPNNGGSDKIEGFPWSVTCFVYQWDYCGKTDSHSNQPTKRRGNVFWLDEWCTDSYSYTNPNKNIKIDCIIESETQTLVRFTATPSKEYKSGQWVNFSPKAYIEIDSKRYYLEEYGGIPLAPNKHYFPNNNSSISFTLYFDKAPIYNKTFKIIEGVEGGFNFYNIKTN